MQRVLRQAAACVGCSSAGGGARRADKANPSSRRRSRARQSFPSGVHRGAPDSAGRPVCRQDRRRRRATPRVRHSVQPRQHPVAARCQVRCRPASVWSVLFRLPRKARRRVVTRGSSSLRVQLSPAAFATKLTSRPSTAKVNAARSVSKSKCMPCVFGTA